MTDDEFEFLSTPAARALVEELLPLEVHAAALKARNSAVASQIKYLQRAAIKLPSYHAARCILDKQGYEQCSSEAAAHSKFEGLDGRLAIDLTCGLGVDSFALSKRFIRVIALETNELRARIAAWNFARLGVDNVEVRCESAEDFLASNSDLRADLIYVDPSRVESEGSARRVYSLEQSSPDVLRILDLILRTAPRAMLKLSPMYDVAECFRAFGTRVWVEVVSVGGECKEVLVKLGFSHGASITSTIIGRQGSESHTFEYLGEQKPIADDNFAPRYLGVADVALVKARCVEAYVAKKYPRARFDTRGYVLSDSELPDFAGQVFRIESVEAYAPRALKKLLKERGIARATVSHYRFDYSSEQIERDLGIKNGGSLRLFFSLYAGRPAVFFVTSPE